MIHRLQEYPDFFVRVSARWGEVDYCCTAADDPEDQQGGDSDKRGDSERSNRV